eukprot:gnl/MRDRNA2_/MRDRNA2_139467_c0_seq1.p1 gnl/MRDRNA2_/MRDRNA2_139467_c0~~gnl/MRDRNA2_/MRDRNA2_139467_c0_seq1.p1  ORF type:complete len:328 (-),score=22.61 gnl/MRDRNA2_/MRDRNA2_139467_c0_seq1:198-1181(-)
MSAAKDHPFWVQAITGELKAWERVQELANKSGAQGQRPKAQSPLPSQYTRLLAWNRAQEELAVASADAQQRRTAQEGSLAICGSLQSQISKPDLSSVLQRRVPAIAKNLGLHSTDPFLVSRLERLETVTSKVQGPSPTPSLGRVSTDSLQQLPRASAGQGQEIGPRGAARGLTEAVNGRMTHGSLGWPGWPGQEGKDDAQSCIPHSVRSIASIRQRTALLPRTRAAADSSGMLQRPVSTQSETKRLSEYSANFKAPRGMKSRSFSEGVIFYGADPDRLPNPVYPFGNQYPFGHYDHFPQHVHHSMPRSGQVGLSPGDVINNVKPVRI